MTMTQAWYGAKHEAQVFKQKQLKYLDAHDAVDTLALSYTEAKTRV